MTPFDLVFYPCLLGGCLAGGLLAFLAAGRRSQLAVFSLGAVAIATVWASLVLGVHYGFGAWQGMEDPPDEAFADGAQLTGSVLFGWLPSATFCLLVFFGTRTLRARGERPVADHV